MTGTKTGGLVDRILGRLGPSDAEPAPAAKSVSLSDRIDAVQEAWRQDHSQQNTTSSWATDVGDDFVIVRDGEDFKRIPYAVDDAGEITFDEAAATEVKREWVEKDLAEVAIEKADDDRQLVFGWANVAIRKDRSTVTDADGDWMTPGDLEDAAYVFNLAFREADEVHSEPVVGHLIESLVVTDEKRAAWATAEGQAEPDATVLAALEKAFPTGWWVGFYIPDRDVYAKCRPGPDGEKPEYAMFSIGGIGLRAAEDPPEAS